MGNRKVLLAALLLALCLPGWAQRLTLSTNVLDYMNFGTVNVEGSVAMGKQWSMVADAKYNPFLFSRDGEPVSARQQAYAAGVRFWPWHVYSGWWFSAKVQYQEYNRGGIRSDQTDEGDRFGAGLSGGFSYMLHPHLNLDFGVGIWGGYDRYVTYSCPVCGLTEQSGERAFVLPNDLTLSLVYVF